MNNASTIEINKTGIPVDLDKDTYIYLLVTNIDTSSQY